MRRIFNIFNRTLSVTLVLVLVTSLFSSWSIQAFAEGRVNETTVDATQAPEPTAAPEAPEPTETPEPVVKMSMEEVVSLYDTLMRCNSLEESDVIMNNYTDEEKQLFYEALSDEQKANLEQKAAKLVSADNMVEEVPEDMSAPDPIPEQIDTSSIINAVNFTKVAPFLAPVEGKAVRLFGLRNAAPSNPETGIDNKDIITTKTATANEDNTYTIRLESYVTGSTITDTISEEIPTDIILVLDQSGSMSSPMGKLAYELQSSTAQNLYNNYRNTLYAKVGDQYNKITVTKEDAATITEYNKLSSSYKSNSQIYNQRNNLYYQVGDKYYKVSIDRKVTTDGILEFFKDYQYIYTYSIVKEDGTTEQIELYDSEVDAKNTEVSAEIRDKLYTSSQTTVYQYTFEYEGKNGTVVTETYSAEDTVDKYYRQYTDNSQSRLEALEYAVQNFTNAVAQKAAGADGRISNTADDAVNNDNVNHRIAIVGFGSGNLSDGAYENTDLFIGTNAYNYGDTTNGASTKYATAFQSMDTENGINNVRATVGYDANGDGDYADAGDIKSVLDASGGTYVDLGIDMANGIFAANPIASGEKRNRVVVVFTDGAPGYNGSWNGKDYGQSGDAQAVADAALNNAYTTKNTYNATAYTVGVFEGANAQITVSSDKQSVVLEADDNSNKFMHYLSSNFMKAKSMSDESYEQTFPKDKDGNFTGDSYYLSASDADALNNIFEKISDMIQSGSSSVDLDATTVVKDVVSNYFKLPDGVQSSDIKISTYSYNPSGKEEADKWVKDSTAYGNPWAVFSGKTVNVTGFDFAANYVDSSNGRLDANNPDKSGTFYGRKLVIEFIVVPEEKFLGGNGVPTNDSESGIYKDDTVMENFEYPRVNVPIQDINMTIQDRNVYLLGSLGKEQMLEGAGATSNGSNLLSSLSWEDDYVNISITEPAALTDLVADTTFSLTITIAPLYNDDAAYSGAAAEKKTASATGNVYVYKPVLTFEDSKIYYGSDEPVYNDVNYVDCKWMHNGTEAVSEAMTGSEPDLNLTYIPGTNAVHSGKVITAKDYYVNVMVKISDADITDEYVEFKHEDCTHNGCEYNNENGEFIIHVLSKVLEINKTFTNGTKPQAGETFIIYIKGTDTVTSSVDMTVTLVADGDGNVDGLTINNLPIGNYTVTEDTAWCWRYEPVNEQGTALGNASYEVTLKAFASTDTVTFTNKLKNNKWIDSNAYCENAFAGYNVQNGKVTANKVDNQKTQ